MRKETFAERAAKEPNPLALAALMKGGQGAHKTAPDHKQERKRVRKECRNMES